MKKKNIPLLRFPEFKDCGEWGEERLGEIFSSLTYGMNAAAKNYDGENKYIRITDIDEKTHKYISNAPVSPSGILEEKYLVQENDILFARTGASTGKTYLYNNDGKLYYAGFLIRGRVKQEYNSYFIFSQTLLEKYKKWVSVESARSGQPGINAEQYANHKVSITHKNEQQKIADCLSSLDNLINAQSEKVETLKSHKKGLLQKLFPQEGQSVPEFRFPEFRNCAEWDYINGDKLFNSISNKNHDSTLPILAITQDKGAIPRDLIDYKVSVTEKSVESYKVVERGDFIISLRSFQGGIEYSEYTGICSPAYIILRQAEPIFDYFYKYFFKTKSFIEIMTRKLEGIRDGKMVSYGQFSELLIPKPKLPEQQKIADCLSSLDDLIDKHSQKLELLKAHKKGLMQGLFPCEDNKE